jgi:hypothetical protein
MSERYFKYPDQVEEAALYAQSMSDTHEVYFCAQLLDRRKRAKDAISRCAVAWADLDSCDPSKLLVRPHVVVKSSPARYQAYWRLSESLDGFEAERLSKRIAYAHRDDGCDTSGWDLTQLLRVPGTKNHKYSGTPVVELEWEIPGAYDLADFDRYPTLYHLEKDDVPFPDSFPDSTAAELLERYDNVLSTTVNILFSDPPTEDWSRALWNLIMSCFEAGLTREETFLVAREAACNKYVRDGKPETLLWKDVCRGFIQTKENAKLASPSKPNPTRLMTEEEYNARAQDTFVDRYIAWASSLGDAATQYHQAGAFVILSALLAGRVYLPTSFGTIKPNVWFMLLADTTLTRKSTAMDIAMDLLTEVDSEPLLATDGSIEGLLGGLAVRPGQPSIFLRDEFSGLLEQMVKKDYYAGMAETLTKLYDGKVQKRVLRKETIEIKDPTLILFAGGIKNRVCSLLTHEYVSSGFIPRFIFITAESNADRIQPMGPPTEVDTTERNRLLDEMRELRARYASEMVNTFVVQGNKKFLQMRPTESTAAKLTPEAWARYNQLEHDMMEAALKKDQRDIFTPTYDRLCKSALRIATLIAASSQSPDEANHIRVGFEHILAAVAYTQEWKEYVDEVLNGLGTTAYEVRMQQILTAIRTQPGISRSALMRSYHLNAREANTLFDTLEMRGEIIKHGKKPVSYTAAGVLS